MKKSKLVLITAGVCLSLLLVIPLYAVLGDGETKSDVIVNPVLPPTDCPKPDPLDHTVILRNPDDCNTFFVCSNGIPILSQCPEGLHFNVQLNVCDWPQTAGCEYFPNDEEDDE